MTLSKYGIRTGCSLAEKGWWPGGQAPFGYDRMTFGPDLKPKYVYRTLPDKSVEKRTPDGKLVETLPPIEDKGKRRSAGSDKLKGDRVRLVLGAQEAVDVVRLIFAKFVNEGWGLRRIAGWLNAKGVVPPRGRKWVYISVRCLLLNPVYKGALVYGRRSDGKHHWLRIQKTEGGYAPIIERKDVPGRTFVHREEDECIVVEDCHPAIVDKALWEAAQERLSGRRPPSIKLAGSGTRSPYLLTGDGLMKCVHCGYRFQGDTDRRNNIRRYMDSGYHMGGKAVCKGYLVPAEPLETWIVGEIRKRIFGNGALFANREELERAIEQALVAGRQAAGSSDKEIRELEGKIAANREKVRLLLSKVSPEYMDMINETLGQIKAETAALEEELRALRVAARAEGIVTRDFKAIARRAAGYVAQLKEVLETGSADERKRFVRAFVHEIVVDGEKRRVKVVFYDDGGQEDSPPALTALGALAERLGQVSPQLVPPTGFEPVLPT